MEPSPLPSVKDFTGFRKSFLLLPGLQRKQTEDGKEHIKLSAVEFWQHLRSTFSLSTDTYWCKHIMISFTFIGFTSTCLIYTEVKCSRAEGGAGNHFSISQINHLHYKLPYRWCWAKAGENHYKLVTQVAILKARPLWRDLGWHFKRNFKKLQIWLLIKAKYEAILQGPLKEKQSVTAHLLSCFFHSARNSTLEKTIK